LFLFFQFNVHIDIYIVVDFIHIVQFFVTFNWKIGYLQDIFKCQLYDREIKLIYRYTLQKKKRNMWKNIIYFKFSTSF
jgi:hypothetical protein